MPLTGSAPMTVQADPEDHGRGKFETSGQRSSLQLYQDFFVPLSQRQKSVKRVVEGEDEPRLSASSTAVDDVVKKKKGRRRKNNPLDDEDRRDFMLSSFEEPPKKSGLRGDDGTLNREVASAASEDGDEKDGRSRTKLLGGSSEFFMPASQKGRAKVERSKDESSPEGAKKRGRPRKNAFDSDGFPTKPLPSGVAADKTRKKSTGKPLATDEDCSTSTALPTDGRKFDKSKRKERVSKELDGDYTGQASAILETADPGQPQVLFEGQPASKGPTNEVPEKLEACDALKERTAVEHGDIRNQGNSSQENEFFMPRSKRSKRKSEVQEEKRNEIRNSPDKSILQKNEQGEQHALPRTRSMVGKAKRSPAKPISIPSKEIHFALPGSAVQQPEQDLRAEAQLAAKEIARLNAGKTTHPFFAMKVSKRTSVFGEEAKRTSVSGEETGIAETKYVQSGAPIHVTQCSEDDKTELTWQFSPSVVDEGSSMDDILRVEGSGCRLMPHLRIPAFGEHNRWPDWNAHPADSLEVGAHGAAGWGKPSYRENDIAASLTALHHLLKSIQTPAPASTVMEEDSQSNEILQRVQSDFSIESLRRRLSWYTARHDTQTSGNSAVMSRVSKESDQDSAPASRNLMWTDLYRPWSSREVCGNTTALACLSGWLYNWKQTNPGKPTKAEIAVDNSREDMELSYDSDKGWFEGDTDSDTDDLDDDNARLRNTLLITGPEGCGKSAAVYACAAELGFSVREMNASSCRSGPLIRKAIKGAMESFELWIRPPGNDFPLPTNAKDLKEPAGSSPSSSSKQRAAKENAAAVKRTGDGLSSEGHQEGSLLMRRNEGGVRRRRNQLILFEDVDMYFEEDKAYLPTLVQLSKTTKRPIILTCNRREPRLSPVLEKFGIDFRYPTPEELVVHTFLVCIAEGVTCSPQIVESLVNSCKLDLRKVMMALQFWGQGGGSEEQLFVSSTSTEFVNGSNGLGLPDGSSHCISDKLSLSRKKLQSLSQSKVPLGREYGNRFLNPWQVHARWLFELDVHHLILPKVCTENCVCPLSLPVAETIREAVVSLDDYAARVVASKLEEGACRLQAKREAAERARKAEMKEKVATRKLFESWTRAEQKRDRNKRLHTPDEEDDVVENLCCDTFVDTPTRAVDTPTKSLREAKNLARSPLQKKKMTPRRALLLRDSDDDEKKVFGGEVIDTEDGNKSTPDVGPPFSRAKRALVLSDSDDEENVFIQSGRNINIADGNQSTSTCNVGQHLPELRQRRTLLLCDSSEGEQDLPTETRIEIASDSQHTFTATLTSSGVQPTMAPRQEKPAHVVTEDVSDADVSFGQISERAEIVTPETPGEHHSGPNDLKPSEALTSGGNVNVGTSISDGKSNLSDAKSGVLLKRPFVQDQNDRPTIAEANPSCTGDGETLEGLEDRKEQVGQRFYYSGDPQAESSLLDRREALIDESTNSLALSPVDARVCSDVSDVVPKSDSLPRLPSREEAVLNASLENEATVQSRGAPTETQPDNMESVGGVPERAERAVTPLTDSAGANSTRSLEAGVQGESASGKFDPVGDAWTRLRSSREVYRSMMNDQVRKSGDVIASLADLVDVISTSDVMSRLQSEDYEDSRRGFEYTVCKACEGHGGQCNHLDICEEVACQFVRTGLQFSAAFPPSGKHIDERLPVVECILESGRDPSAIGKCMVAYASLTNKSEGGIDIGARLKSLSHADKEARLKDVIYPAVLPRGRVSSTAFVEYSAYLSRMSHLEELRRAHTVVEERRRSRRFDHRLASKSFSDSGIVELLKLSKYGNA